MALIRALAVAVVLCACPVGARAASDAGAPDGGTGPADAADADGGLDAATGLEPPVPLTDTNVPAPPDAPPQSAPVIVTAQLVINAQGTVDKVQVTTPPQPIFDEAVVSAAKAFRFRPARSAGVAIPVEITFTHTFLPRPPAPPAGADQGPPRTAALRGRLIELATRVPLDDATVTATVGGRSYSVDVDRTGHFRLPLPPGTAKIQVFSPSHNPFLQQETLAPFQELAVTYLVQRDRYDPYETVVVGQRRRREEVSRITLRGPELQQIPGTFGDPFRVIQTLPGVASVVSLLPFPVVRGASPSSTGFLLDGTNIPLLYHLLVGASVIHPEFIDEIQFYPGGAPAPYGQYTGGIIDGRTARARPDAHLLDFDLNLLQAGAFAREPIKPLGATFTVAARYGYPGLILGLATDQISLAYWDYQARIDGGTPRNGWTAFFFGANDELDTRAATAPNSPAPPLAPALILGFHRIDLRDHQTQGAFDETFRVVLGRDHTFSSGTDFTVWSAEPSIVAQWAHGDGLTLDAGVIGSVRDIIQGSGANASAGSLAAITAPLHKFDVGSAYLEALWRPTPRLLIRPGLRADAYTDGDTDKAALDPRLTVRYRLFDRDLPQLPNSDDRAVWLKASAGIYHQPPRFVLPLPGLDMLPLKYGLLQAYQTSLGTEVPLQNHFQISAEGFFNYMDPTIFDLAVNDPSVVNAPHGTLLPPFIANPVENFQQIIQRLTQPETGRSYGLEFLLRRQAKNGVFGWISYTISRSERLQQGQWVAYDFDRTQLLNLVAGLPLQRNWDLGLRAQYESGRPVTISTGYNGGRTDGYWRFDLRVDKRALWKKWLLDFYVDITNVALMPEEVTPGTVIRYVLPTVGLRGRL